MTSTPPGQPGVAGAPQMDPADLDLDAWIDGIATERTVVLYPPDPQMAERATRLRAQLDVAERTDASERGLDELSPETIRAQIAELQEQWEASGKRVRVRELMPEQIAQAARDYREAGGAEEDIGLCVCAAACIEPAFTVEQLKRLGARGRAGDAMLGQLLVATTEQWQRPSVPFSPASSSRPDGGASSAS